MKAFNIFRAWSIKSKYSTMASLLLDIDGDGIISRKDMDSVLDLMTDNTMDDELKNHIIDGVGCAY